jgi:hypothetical protein
MDTPKMPPLNKRAEFLVFLVWVALIGAVVILAIDYSIKQSILQSAQEAKGMLDAVKGTKAGPSNSASPTRGEPGGMRSDANTQMEVGIVPAQAQANGKPRAANGRFAKPETGNADPGIPGPSESV